MDGQHTSGMTSVSHNLQTEQGETAEGLQWPKGLVVDVSGLDLNGHMLDKAGLEKFIPHRGEMSLLDQLVWRSDDFRLGVARKFVRHDEFWVAGHFPGQPMLPGVLQVEAAAQLSVYLWNARQDQQMTAVFTRIERCSFRSMVQPGDVFYLLAQEIKWSRRGFVIDVQGMVNRKLTFDAQIHGLAINGHYSG